MPSPFPGMDPYLEDPRRWLGFHNNLIIAMQAQLNQQILPRYFAEVEPFVVDDLLGIGRRREILPDIGVLTSPLPDGGSLELTAIAPAPVQSVVPVRTPARLLRLEIRTLSDEELVTVIELLSPANKRRNSRDYRKYLSKRESILDSTVHFMEVDLLRKGARPPLERSVPAAPYYTMLSRVERRPVVDVWPIQLWEKLPTIQVPLQHPDPDAGLDLGAALAEVYERAGYSARIDYRQPPPPPLSEAEAAWVEQLLKDYRQRA